MKKQNYLFFSKMILLIALTGCSNTEQAKLSKNQKPLAAGDLKE
ncbi:hypothetical protein V7266_23815 [Neobacillus drentensis]